MCTIYQKKLEVWFPPILYCIKLGTNIGHNYLISGTVNRHNVLYVAFMLYIQYKLMCQDKKVHLNNFSCFSFLFFILATVPNGNSKQNGDSGNRSCNFYSLADTFWFVHILDFSQLTVYLVWICVFTYGNPMLIFWYPGRAETHLPPVTQRSGLLCPMVMLSVVPVLLPNLQGAPRPPVLSDQPDLLLLSLADQQPHHVGKKQHETSVKYLITFVKI